MKTVAKTKLGSSRDAIQKALFDWEFLRRNEKYRTSYKRFLKTYPGYELSNGGSPGWLAAQAQARGEDPRKPAKDSFHSRFVEDRLTFLETWGIYPTDPKLPAHQSPFFRHGTIWVTPCMEAGSSILTLTVSLDGPLLEILNQVTFAIEHLHSGANAKKMRRRRFDEYRYYLIAYDLNKKGKTDREIANILAKDAGFPNFENPVKRVFEYRKRAKQLILLAARKTNQ